MLPRDGGGVNSTGASNLTGRRLDDRADRRGGPCRARLSLASNRLMTARTWPWTAI